MTSKFPVNYKKGSTEQRQWSSRRPLVWRQKSSEDPFHTLSLHSSEKQVLLGINKTEETQ